MSTTYVESYLEGKYPDPVERARVAKQVFQKAVSDICSRVTEINGLISTLRGYSQSLANVATVCAELCQSQDGDDHGPLDHQAYRELLKDWPALAMPLFVLSPVAANAS